MVLFYKIWTKYNKIKLTKNKMDLNNRKIIYPPRNCQTNLHAKGIYIISPFLISFTKLIYDIIYQQFSQLSHLKDN